MTRLAKNTLHCIKWNPFVITATIKRVRVSSELIVYLLLVLFIYVNCQIMLTLVLNGKADIIVLMTREIRVIIFRTHHLHVLGCSLGTVALTRIVLK